MGRAWGGQGAEGSPLRMSKSNKDAEPEGTNVESKFAELLANHSKIDIPDNFICHFWHASLDPHKFPIRQWEIAVLFIICYSTLVTPYRAAFSTEHGNDWFDWLVDACFYFDIMRMFWTSYDRGVLPPRPDAGCH